MSDSATSWTAAHQASLSITNTQSLLKLMSIGSVIPSKHILCCPLLLLSSIFPSIRVFSNESVLHIRWPKFCSFSFSISPFNKYSQLISFSMDWLDLLAVQGTLKSLLQHRSSKASILWCSPFFIVQLSHPYMTTGKAIPLTRCTVVSKVMSLLFNILSIYLLFFTSKSLTSFTAHAISPSSSLFLPTFSAIEANIYLLFSVTLKCHTLTENVDFPQEIYSLWNMIQDGRTVKS